MKQGGGSVMSVHEKQQCALLARLRVILPRLAELSKPQAANSEVLWPAPPGPTALIASGLTEGRLIHLISLLKEPLRRAPPETPPLNVWSVAGLKRDERRNAAVLAWLLSPNGSHGFGAAILQALFDRAAATTPSWPSHLQMLSMAQVATEEWPVGSAAERVDIAIDGPGFAVFVEVKVDAPEGPSQLQRYADLIQRKAQALGRDHGLIIYLSSRRPRNAPLGTALLTWKDVAEILMDLPQNGLGGMLAKQFAAHVRAFF